MHGRIAAITRDAGTLAWEYRIPAAYNRTVVAAGSAGGSAGGGRGGSAPGGRGGIGGAGGNSGDGPGSGARGGGQASGATAATSTVLLRDTSISAPLSLSGGALYVVTDDGNLSAFRPDAPDTTPPQITYQYPRSGQSANGKPPFTVAARLSDIGSGIDPASVKLFVDDEEKAQAVFSLTNNQIGFETKSGGRGVSLALPDGRHSARVTAKDWRGNVLDSEWSFVIDNTLPASRRNAPVVAPPPAAAVAPGVRPGGAAGSGGANGSQAGGRRGGGRRGGNSAAGGGRSRGN